MVKLLQERNDKVVIVQHYSTMIPNCMHVHGTKKLAAMKLEKTII